MANSYNKIFIVGHLGRDAELRTTPQGKSVATASLAVEDLGKKDDQGKPTTEWYRVKVWGKQGEAVSPYMTKGKSILVEGRLSIQTWVDKDSKNRYTPEVSADRVTGEDFLQPYQPASGLPYRQAAVNRGDSTRVIAPVLQPLKPDHDDVREVARPDVADYAAHIRRGFEDSRIRGVQCRTLESWIP